MPNVLRAFTRCVDKIIGLRFHWRVVTKDDCHWLKIARVHLPRAQHFSSLSFEDGAKKQEPIKLLFALLLILSRRL